MTDTDTETGQPRRALCRHCGQQLREITEQPGRWMDLDGFEGCVKARHPKEEPVLHQPMPAGLRGAPEPAA